VNAGRIVLLVTALAVTGLTVFLVRGYLARQTVPAVVEVKSSARAEVLVASKDLPAGTVLAADSVRWQGWPEDSVNENYLTKNSATKREELVGAAVKRAVLAGEPITVAKVVLKPKDAGFLAGALGPGMRAMTIKVSPVTGAAGFILPGTRVDVLLTQQIQSELPSGGTARRVVSETVLDDVRVIAIDQKVADLEAQAKLSDTVTLEVTPKQGEMLAASLEMGKLSLSVRSLVRNAEVEARAPYTRDEEVSRFLGKSSARTVRMLIAGRDLPAGALLRDTDLAWLPLPNGTPTDEYVIEGQPSAAGLRGALLKTAVKSGESLRGQQLIRPGEQGFIMAALGPGLRAVSVAITQVSGVSGYIGPGDRVDVIMTHQVNDTSQAPPLSPRRFSETVAEDVRLLALEQSLDPATGKPVVGQTATFEVTPREAETLALAAAMGQLSVALRGVPSGSPRAPGDEIYTSDLSISNAVADFLVFGTRAAPQVAMRLGNGAVSNVSIGGQSRSVRVYRAVTPSTVLVSP